MAGKSWLCGRRGWQLLEVELGEWFEPQGRMRRLRQEQVQ